VVTYAAGSAPVSGGVPVGVSAGVPGEVLIGVPGDVPTGAPAGAPGVAGPARSAGLRRRDRGRRSHAIAQIPAFTRPGRHAVVRHIADHASIPNSRFAPAATETGQPPSVALKCDISPTASKPAPEMPCATVVSKACVSSSARRAKHDRTRCRQIQRPARSNCMLHGRSRQRLRNKNGAASADIRHFF